jgi:hypothetical protein
MNIAILGIDLGKNSCSVVGLDVSASAKATLNHALTDLGIQFVNRT